MRILKRKEYFTSLSQKMAAKLSQMNAASKSGLFKTQLEHPNRQRHAVPRESMSGVVGSIVTTYTRAFGHRLFMTEPGLSLELFVLL